MENQKNVIQLIGIGFFLCLNFYALDNVSYIILKELFIFVGLFKFSLYVLSYYIVLILVIVIFYLSLRTIKRLYFKGYSFSRFMIFFTVTYISLYVLAVFLPFLHNYVINLDLYMDNIETYYRMIDKNHTENIIVKSSTSILKVVVFAFIFLKEVKVLKTSYAENNKILDKD